MDKVMLRKVAEDLRALSDSLLALCEEAPKQEAPPQVSLEQVRGILADKSRAGHTAKIREILKRYGADKLSAVDPKHYEAILKEAEGLSDE